MRRFCFSAITVFCLTYLHFIAPELCSRAQCPAGDSLCNNKCQLNPMWCFCDSLGNNQSVYVFNEKGGVYLLDATGQSGVCTKEDKLVGDTKKIVNHTAYTGHEPENCLCTCRKPAGEGPGYSTPAGSFNAEPVPGQQMVYVSCKVAAGATQE